MIPESINTARLVLRPWSLADVDDIFAYAQDEEWSRFLRFIPKPYSRSDAEAFLAMQAKMDRGKHQSWAIVLGRNCIGGINIRLDESNCLGEIGYSVARAQWNNGYCTEAARAVIDAAFEAIADLNRIRAMADESNSASHRVLRKVGMTKEGVLRQNRVERGEVIDEAWFGILRSEWRPLSN
jgi:ribosomal-protein-alanine N-acetyltransferase